MNIRGLLIAGACVALSAVSAFAQYTIQSSVIGSGGGPASNSTYSMNGTVGQPVIGMVSGSQYTVGQGFWHSLSATSGVNPFPGGPVAGYDLEQNFPNPCTSTQINFSLPLAGPTRLIVYNALGQAVRTLVDGDVSQGSHQVKFDAKDDAGNELSSGNYIYRLQSGDFTATRKMTLTR